MVLVGAQRSQTGMTLPPIVVVVPMPDNIANSRMHWRARDRVKKEYAACLDDMQNCGLIPSPPKAPLQKATVRSVMQLGNAMDDDNAVARHKPVLDWLKTRGYIVDDRRANLRWESFPEQRVKRNGRYSITLTVTPMEAAA